MAGLDARETETESPDALEATRRLTLAWLRQKLGAAPDDWTRARESLRGAAGAIARVDLIREARVPVPNDGRAD